jgi:hypothetical protein
MNEEKMYPKSPYLFRHKNNLGKEIFILKNPFTLLGCLNRFVSLRSFDATTILSRKSMWFDWRERISRFGKRS